MTRRGPHSRAFSVFLVKEGTVQLDAILQNPAQLHQRDLNLSETVKGKLYIKPSQPHEPAWLLLFKDQIEPSPELVNTSTAAILLVSQSARTFALAFGYGRSLLVPGCYEEQFGLRVTLNSIDPNRIRSIDRTSFDTVGQQAQVQASRESSITDFRLDVEQDILRGVTASPMNTELGDRLTGKDSLNVSVKGQLSDLPRLLDAWLHQSELTTYKQNFPWVDHIHEVRDPLKQGELDQELIALVRRNHLDRMWLAPPEPVNWTSVAGFRYRDSERAVLHYDTHLRDFLNELNDASAVEIDDLKKRRSVHLISAETGLPIKRWAVYQCLYCELDWHCHQFLLTNGTWYEIQPEFMKVVNDSVNDLVKATSLPPYSDASEEAYNIRTSQEILGLVLMDQDFIRYAGAAGPIEFCDLYSASKEIIHVKRYGASSTLSHLFSQGLVSGTLFARDAEFRSHVNAKLPATHKLASSDDHLRASEYTVVFAVVSQSQKPLQLPFFSRVNLRNAARQLQGLGFKVQVVKINAQARNPLLNKVA